MPSAVVETDGTFSVGYSYDSPYGQLWATANILPFLQMTGRYVSITGIPALPMCHSNMAVAMAATKESRRRQITPVDGSRWMPSVAVGMTDLFGTELFKGQYVVATKTFGASKNIEASTGYARKRPDGVFARRAGRRQPCRAGRWWLNTMRPIVYADSAPANRMRQAQQGASVGLEYRWGWLALQAARSRDQFSVNAFVSIPFGEREFVPKVYEPAYFVDDKNPPPLPSKEEWHRDAVYGADPVNAWSNRTTRISVSSKRQCPEPEPDQQPYLEHGPRRGRVPRAPLSPSRRKA
jgi:hypothetical protein